MIKTNFSVLINQRENAIYLKQLKIILARFVTHFYFVWFLFVFFLVCLFFFLNSLCRPGWPRTQRSACLCLPGAGIKGTCHHRPAKAYSPKSSMAGIVSVPWRLRQRDCKQFQPGWFSTWGPFSNIGQKDKQCTAAWFSCSRNHAVTLRRFYHPSHTLSSYFSFPSHSHPSS